MNMWRSSSRGFSFHSSRRLTVLITSVHSLLAQSVDTSEYSEGNNYFSPNVFAVKKIFCYFIYLLDVFLLSPFIPSFYLFILSLSYFSLSFILYISLPFSISFWSHSLNSVSRCLSVYLISSCLCIFMSLCLYLCLSPSLWVVCGPAASSSPSGGGARVFWGGG